MKILIYIFLFVSLNSPAISQAWSARVASVINADTGRASSNKATAGTLKWVNDSTAAAVAAFIAATYSPIAHSHTFASITSPPTTVAGYGITDAPKIVASINATAQAANIGTATLYAVPSAGFYRVSIYITITQAATTSSTMPSTTIAYTDGNSGTNAHSTTTTATNTGNSLTTSFAQTTYVLYAKASTNITYATGSYASSGGTAMQYALRIRVEAL